MDPFPDIENVLRALLLRDFAANLPSESRVGTDFIVDFTDRLPYIRLERVGGSSVPLNDYPLVDVEFFDDTTADLKSLSADVHTYLLGYPHTVELGSRRITLDTVGVTVAPRRLPWADENIRRFAATYQFSVRR